MREYHGSCHCGNVKFLLNTSISEFTTCDCSLCVKKNAHMLKVHESEFTLQSDWDTVSEYQWNTRVARHYFCKRCGIYTFHRKRSAPEFFGINVYCIDNLDASSINTVATEGANMTIECTEPRDVWPGPVR